MVIHGHMATLCLTQGFAMLTRYPFFRSHALLTFTMFIIITSLFMIKSTMAKLYNGDPLINHCSLEKYHHLSINFPMKKSAFGAMIFHLKPPKSISDSWGVHSPSLAISSCLNQFTMVHHSGWITIINWPEKCRKVLPFEDDKKIPS